MFARVFLPLLCVVALSVTLSLWGCSTTTGAQKTAKDPKQAEVEHNFSLGLIHMNHQEWVKAEKSFMEVLKFKPQSYPTRLYLAKVYNNQGKPDKAAEQLREAIKLNSKDSRAYSLLMDYHGDSGQTDKAIATGELVGTQRRSKPKLAALPPKNWISVGTRTSAEDQRAP